MFNPIALLFGGSVKNAIAGTILQYAVRAIDKGLESDAAYKYIHEMLCKVFPKLKETGNPEQLKKVINDGHAWLVSIDEYLNKVG